MKTVLITGSSTGLGRVMSEAMARNGYRVFASMRDIKGKNEANAKELTGLAQTENIPLEVVELDVTSQPLIDKAVDHILSTAGTLDVVINNAGLGTDGPVETISIEKIQTIFDVNVMGPLRVSRAALPHMRKKKSGL
ncbi:MAG: SDR family NAD(P)-dependent oxidoreductase, partial [bacterium]|nr:SDR family NAD(P)-dependent oxidoreductase [bacterium]